MVTIGMVNYINTAPLYEMWKQHVDQDKWTIIEAPPSTLNRMLANDKLDLGIVSSYEYALRPEKYRILQDLSISADGPIGSVFLFSKVPFEHLSGQRVLLTGQSDTSIALVRIILEEFYQIQPRYSIGEVFDFRNYDEDVIAVLAIGDEALRLKIQNAYPYRLDLAEIWNKTTSLPFVFALCVVREDYVQSDAQELTKIWQTLIECKRLGDENLEEISRVVAPRIPMSHDACYSYLKTIEYDLSSSHKSALEKFFSYLIKRGEASKDALPLKFFPEESLSAGKVI